MPRWTSDRRPGRTHRSRRITPVVKRNDHPDVDETGTIEQQVDDVGKHAVLGGLVEETAASPTRSRQQHVSKLIPPELHLLPGESAPTSKRREQVVTSEQRADACIVKRRDQNPRLANSQ